MRDGYVEPFQPDVLAERHALDGAAIERLSTLVTALENIRTNARPKIADALTGLELAQVRGARRMADLGTGMGTPGLVLAAVLPDTAVTLVEKNPVRCAFLERAAHSMGLRNVAVVEASVPEWTAGYAAFDLVTSRAAAAPGELLAWAAPLLAPGGSFVAWAGAEHGDAFAQAAEAATGTLGLRPTLVHATEIVDGRERVLHVFERTGAATRPPAPIAPPAQAAIELARRALDWQAGLDPAERDRFLALAHEHAGGELGERGRDELARLCERLGAPALLHEAQRVAKALRRRSRRLDA